MSTTPNPLTSITVPQPATAAQPQKFKVVLRRGSEPRLMFQGRGGMSQADTQEMNQILGQLQDRIYQLHGTVEVPPPTTPIPSLTLQTPTQPVSTTTPTPPSTAIIHQFWAYTYEPTLQTTTDASIKSDPGILEQGKGVYFAMPIPTTTIVDTVSYSLEGIADPFSPQIGPASASIYQMDQVANTYQLLGFATSTANTANTGFFSMQLNNRLTLSPGEYAIGWFSFCALYLCVRIAIDAAALANLNAVTPKPPRFGVVTLDGIGINASWPAVISSNNAISTGQAIGTDPVMPILFFEDSQGLG